MTLYISRNEKYYSTNSERNILASVEEYLLFVYYKGLTIMVPP